jgi:hypothetical protein
VKNGFLFKITKEDITWMLCRDLPNSFGRAETNNKAIAEHGWGPFKYVMIDDPALQ